MKFILPIAITALFAFIVFAPLEWSMRVLESRIVEWAMYALLGVTMLGLIGAAWAWAIWT